MLAASPGKVWADLEKEGAIVITKDGIPRSIMVPTSDATLIEDVREIVFARARKAVREIRARAAETGAAESDKRRHRSRDQGGETRPQAESSR